MDTTYIGPHQWERPDGREVRREFRIEDSEAYPGLLDLHTVNYANGDDMGTAHLDREQATKLRDTLNEFLMGAD